MSEFCIFHNPRCSKSRQALQLLREQGIEPEVRLYLQDPPDPEEIRRLLARLGLDAHALLRRGEVEFKEQNLADPTLSEDDLIAAMTRYPRLIERPIVVRGERAVVGRPPEQVLALCTGMNVP